MQFIDLFAGLGGFHLALSRLGHKCVFACEINPTLNNLYKKNFPKTPIELDITKVNRKKIPNYDILCAGFPCQPFSKAGAQAGFNHKVAGQMFEELMKFVSDHKPEYLILENVPQLIKHNKGVTWDYMYSRIEAEGYLIEYDIISPTDFNIPQTRERVFILCTKNQNQIKWPIKPLRKDFSLKDIFIKSPKIFRTISKEKNDVLLMWEDFLKRIPSNITLTSPLWTLEFGATYPFEDRTPYSLDIKELKKYRGSRGIDLSKFKSNEIINNLPPYAQYTHNKKEDRLKNVQFPIWKKNFIRRSRDFYIQNREWIDPWIKKYDNHPNPMLKSPTHLKFEWNCMGEDYTLDDKVLSFRPSGLRVKRLNAAPTLVNISSLHTPYIPSLKRYMSNEECLKIQGLHELLNDNFPNNIEINRAIGNAVNADIVEKIASVFLDKTKAKNYRKKNNQLSFKFDNAP